MKFVVLTGMSGAGKSTALKVMEDIGYFCVDNLPIVLMEKFAELANVPGAELQKVAIGVDIRSGRARMFWTGSGRQGFLLTSSIWIPGTGCW